MNTAEKFTVIGAGHGGKAMAAHLSIMGAEIALWNRTFDHISIVKKRGGIELESTEGGPHGFGKLKMVTSDMSEAIPFAQVIMVVLPSSAHADIAKAAAPYLKDGQIVRQIAYDGVADMTQRLRIVIETMEELQR